MKKKLILIVLVLILILVDAALIGVLVRGINAAKSADSDAVEVCKTFFDAYAQLDGETAGAQLTGLGTPITFGELTGALAEQMTVKLGKESVNEDGDTIISAEIETISMRAVFEELPEELDGTEDAQEWLAETFEETDVPTEIFCVDIKLTEEAGKLKIVMTEALSDALLGGYYSMLNEMIEEAA